MTVPILSVRNLQVEFVTRRGTLRAIDDVSFDIAKGEVLGVVGESGAGKSVTGLAAIGLIDPPGRISGGEILLSGSRIDNLPPEEMRRIRGKRIGMDASGRIASHTGRECVDWCGHLEGAGFSIAGNMVAGAQVLDETANAYVANAKLPFAQRLIAAMKAGEAAGGDKRGKQSAALLIHGEEDWSNLDLRVDDHTDPLAELERLEQVSRERWVHFRQFLPTRKNPAGVTDRAVIDASVQAAIASQS